MSQCNECRTERDITNEGRLARLETKIDGIDEKLDDAILSQLKDHGKRIAALDLWRHEHERRGSYHAGWVAGAASVGGAVGGAVVWLAGKMWGGS